MPDSRSLKVSNMLSLLHFSPRPFALPPLGEGAQRADEGLITISEP